MKEGPLFLASFAPKVGLFGAVSFDEGETWPVKRLITDGQPDHQVERMDGHLFTMGPTALSRADTRPEDMYPLGSALAGPMVKRRPSILSTW